MDKNSGAANVDNKWGMVIDLDLCNGCGACVTACGIENNLPVVGEEESAIGRGMHWIRIQRYWEGEYPHFLARYIPVMCQQCGAAPCEAVCPVYATYHSEPEAINVQVYNRCVGTRFCAQNCPYVSRVFNWFDYTQVEPMNNYFNPDVTRRTRGIMEKCTFCLQRIRRAQEDAEHGGYELSDGDVQTACSQACPTGAIIFGNLSDPESKVARLANTARAYRIFEDLGTKPKVYYLKGSETGLRGISG